MLLHMRRLRHLWTNQSGSVLLIFGLSFIVLVVAAGAAYDLGKQQLVRMKMQQAGDAAALGGAINSQVSLQLQPFAKMLFELNYPATYIGVSRPTPSINITTSTIQVSANATVPTSFMGNVGITTIPAASDSVTALANESADFDIVVVVDQSNSTSGGGTPSIMDQEKAALNTLAGYVYGGFGAGPNARMGVIGYTQHISEKSGLSSNSGDTTTAISNLTPMHYNYDHYGLEAALNMITNNTTVSTPNGSVPYFTDTLSLDCTDNRYTSALPAGNTCYNNFIVALPTVADPCFLYPEGLFYDYTVGGGLPSGYTALPVPPGNLCQVRSSCAVPTAGAACITSVKQVHKRNTDVPPARTARSDSAPLSPTRAVVLIGDGLLMREPDGCANGPTFMDEPRTAGAPCPNYPKFLAECQRIKDSGAVLFVAVFYTPPGIDETTLKRCASIEPASGLPRYAYATTQADLEAFLGNAFLFISKVRLFK